uniref:Major facilitator superfamily (MFS) profile domain-containing protein n=1 Tax=Aureoumbra lagunensis TaxID=44058 RepID=A0A7S3JNW3_9STRA
MMVDASSLSDEDQNMNENAIPNPLISRSEEEQNQQQCVLESIEIALEIASRKGNGKYQYRITFLTGLLYAADSMEVSLLSFLYECVGASLHLSSARAATIVAIVFCGEFLGSIIAWPAAEYLGRRQASLLSAILVAVFGLLTTIAWSFFYFYFVSIYGWTWCWYVCYSIRSCCRVFAKRSTRF